MKTLLILRHGKSSWKDDELDDHDRPLKKRGKRDSARMGQVLRDEDLVPDLILCSTATRARDTALRVAEGAGYDGECREARELYLAAPDAYLGVLRELPESVNRVLVVGHNPGLEDLVMLLAGVSTRMPTAALAHVQLPVESWPELGAETPGELHGRWRPRELD